MAPDDHRGAFFAYGESGLQALLSDVVEHDHRLAGDGRSYWWTAGNAQSGPAIIAQAGMPDATGFAAMLRGFGPQDDNGEPEPESTEEPHTDVKLGAPDEIASPFAAGVGWSVRPSKRTLEDNAPKAPEAQVPPDAAVKHQPLSTPSDTREGNRPDDQADEPIGQPPEGTQASSDAPAKPHSDDDSPFGMSKAGTAQDAADGLGFRKLLGRHLGRRGDKH